MYIYLQYSIEMEKEREEQSRLKVLKMERKQLKEKQLVLPEASSADFERQLRKLATKGGELILYYCILHYFF
jgi:hypothetical protein